MRTQEESYEIDGIEELRQAEELFDAPSPLGEEGERYLVTGVSGQLGHALHELWDYNNGPVLARARESFDVCSSNVATVLERMRPDVVINCAAYTDVYAAEHDREACWSANAKGANNLARACSELSIPMVHVSSSHVFGTDTSRRFPSESTRYQEHDPVGPVSFYGQAKAAAEHAVLRYAAVHPEWQYYIVRTAGVFEPPWRTHSNQVFRTAVALLKPGLQEFRAVADQWGNLTYAPHLAKAIRWLVENRTMITADEGVLAPSGIYHLVNQGELTPAELAGRLSSRLGAGVLVDRVDRRTWTASHQLPTNALPAFTCLDCSRYESLSGPKLPSWQEAVDEWCDKALSYFRGGTCTVQAAAATVC